MNNISNRDLFEFDLRGYLILRQFVPPSIIDRMNSVIDASPSGKNAPKFAFVTLDPVFMDFISDRRILNFCDTWINPYFRFDHAWGVQQYPGSKLGHINLHAGQYANQGFFQYHWSAGKPVCSCLVFALIMEPQPAGEGGFVVVPGSHKSNSGLAGMDVFHKILQTNLNTDIVHQPVLEPGDVLLFTEALIHGTAAWKYPEKRRRNLYFKYCMGSMGWLPQDHEEINQLRARARNEQEKLLFRPAYVARRSFDPDLDWRTPTYIKL
jgi:hypothetical protein